MPETYTNDSLQLRNVQIDDLLTMGDDAPIDLDEHSSSPSTPPSGRVRLYAKSDGKLYQKDDGGSETSLDATTAGAVMKTDYNANTVLAADSDDTPQALTVAASRLIGRKSSGPIAALAAADVLGVVASALWPVRQVNGWCDGDWVMGRTKSTGPAPDWTLTADKLILLPFWSPFDDWNQIGIEVATADSGKELKLALYDTGSDGLPGTAVWESSAIDLGTTGEKTLSLGTQPDPGWWWIGLNSDSSSSSVVASVPQIRPISATTVQGNGGYHYSKSGVSYSVDPFPDSPSGLTATTASNPKAPWVKMRITS